MIPLEEIVAALLRAHEPCCCEHCICWGLRQLPEVAAAIEVQQQITAAELLGNHLPPAAGVA